MIFTKLYYWVLNKVFKKNYGVPASINRKFKGIINLPIKINPHEIVHVERKVDGKWQK